MSEHDCGKPNEIAIVTTDQNDEHELRVYVQTTYCCAEVALRVAEFMLASAKAAIAENEKHGHEHERVSFSIYVPTDATEKLSAGLLEEADKVRKVPTLQ